MNMNKLNEFVKDLIKRGILVSGVSIRNEELAYDINGFAKSGTGTLFIEDGKIKLETRYKRIDIIESLSDLVDVAFEWDYGYCNKNSIYTVYSVSEEWMNLYKEFGKDTTIFR